MCPRGVTGRHVVKNCGEDRTDAKYNANLGNNYIQKLNNKPSPKLRRKFIFLRNEEYFISK
jgi:hypothetical protein